jgi:hypothetical protein
MGAPIGIPDPYGNGLTLDDLMMLAPPRQGGGGFKQRLMQALPGMIRGGIAAGATPNIAGGGGTDILRALQAANDANMQADLLSYNMGRQRRDDAMRQDQLRRQFERDEEYSRHNRALEERQGDIHERQMRAAETSQQRADESAISNALREPGVRILGPGEKPGPGFVRSFGPIRVYYPTQEELDSQPLSQSAVAKLQSGPRPAKVIPRTQTSTFESGGDVQVPLNPGEQIEGPPQMGGAINSPRIPMNVTVPVPSPEGYNASPVRLQDPEQQLVMPSAELNSDLRHPKPPTNQEKLQALVEAGVELTDEEQKYFLANGKIPPPQRPSGGRAMTPGQAGKAAIAGRANKFYKDAGGNYDAALAAAQAAGDREAAALLQQDKNRATPRGGGNKVGSVLDKLRGGKGAAGGKAVPQLIADALKDKPAGARQKAKGPDGLEHLFEKQADGSVKQLR